MELKECAVCSAKALHRCSKCKLAAYCSPAHQALVWPKHKLICGVDQGLFVQLPLTKPESDLFAKHSPVYLKLAGELGLELRNLEGTFEDALRVAAPDKDPLDEFWRRIRLLHASMDLKSRTLSIVPICYFLTERNLCQDFARTNLGIFYRLARVHNTIMWYAQRDFTSPEPLAHQFNTFLHIAFDYHSLLGLAQEQFLRPTFDLEYLQTTFERVRQANTSLIQEVGSPPSLVAILEMEVTLHQSRLRMMRGANPAEESAYQVAEAGKLQRKREVAEREGRWWG